MSAFNSSNRLWASVESIIHKMTYAWSIFWKVRSIPRFSIVSFVWRIPAVSINRNVTPCKLIVSSITSRVVPWISLTMAFSSFSNAFSKVDFPAFVSPIIATGMPFLIAFPTLKEWASRAITCSIWVARLLSSSRLANSSSSWSLKSSSNSINEVKWSNWLRRLESSLLNPPRIWLMARRWVEADDEAIRSATASAWLKSIFPFRKARWVYSPGRAARHPL